MKKLIKALKETNKILEALKGNMISEHVKNNIQDRIDENYEILNKL